MRSSGRRGPFILTDEEVEASPSRVDGVSASDERMLRVYGCECVQAAGMLLRLPQQVCATAQVMFQRFYCKRSFVLFKADFVAMAALWLASKLDECPRALRDVLQVFYRLDRRRRGLTLVPLDFAGPLYAKWRGKVIVAERFMLREFGFAIDIEHPHKAVLVVLSPQVLNASGPMVQAAFSYLNDSLRTTACVRFAPEAMACAAIRMAARRVGEALPPSWWLMFDGAAVTEAGMDAIQALIEDLYRMPKAHAVVS